MKHHYNSFIIIDSEEWSTLTPETLWDQVKRECKAYFDWELAQESCGAFVEKFQITKVEYILIDRYQIARWMDRQIND